MNILIKNGTIVIGIRKILKSESATNAVLGVMSLVSSMSTNVAKEANVTC